MSRFREKDFDEVHHEEGVSPAWPITYADLAPYYDLAESLLGSGETPAATQPTRCAQAPIPILPFRMSLSSQGYVRTSSVRDCIRLYAVIDQSRFGRRLCSLRHLRCISLPYRCQG